MSTLFNLGYLCRGRDPIRIMICFLNCIFGVYSKGVGMATDLWIESPLHLMSALYVQMYGILV